MYDHIMAGKAEEMMVLDEAAFHHSYSPLFVPLQPPSPPTHTSPPLDCSSPKAKKPKCGSQC
jgi:hypothetical protein